MPCLVMQLSSEKIQPGGRVTITMMERQMDNSLVPYPDDKYFWIWIEEAGRPYGTLRCVATGEIGTDLFCANQPFEFITADNIDGDSVRVEISAWPLEGISTSMGTPVPADPVNSNVKSKTGFVQAISSEALTCGQKIKKIIERKKAELARNNKQASKAFTADNINAITGTCTECLDCAQSRWVTIKKETLCPVVRLSKEEIDPGDTVEVEVWGKNESEELVPYPPDQLFNISILTGIEAGELVSQQKGKRGTDLTDVPSPALFIANENIGVDSIKVDIRAWLSSGSAGGSSTGTTGKDVKEIHIESLTIDQLIKISNSMNKGAAYRLLKGKLDKVTNDKSSRKVDLATVNKLETALTVLGEGGFCEWFKSLWIKEVKAVIQADVKEYLISSEPKMPVVRLSARVKNSKPNTIIKYNWEVYIQWNDPSFQTWPKILEPFKREVTLQQPLDVWFMELKDELENEIFIGGDITTIRVTATIDGKEYKTDPLLDKFTILGNSV